MVQESPSMTTAFQRGNGLTSRLVLLVASGEVVHARLARLFQEREYRTLVASCDAEVAGALAHIPFAFTVVDTRCAGPEALAALKTQRSDLGAIIVLSDGKTGSTADADVLGAQCTIGGCWRSGRSSNKHPAWT